MSDEVTDIKVKDLATLYVSKCQQVIRQTRILIDIEEKTYKEYQKKVLELTDKLDNIPKKDKSKRADIKTQIKEYQATADKYFKNYLTECEDLYNLNHGLYKKQP